MISLQGCKDVYWTHEYASYCIEGVPGKPYGKYAIETEILRYVPNLGPQSNLCEGFECTERSFFV